MIKKVVVVGAINPQDTTGSVFLPCYSQANQRWSAAN